MIAVFLNCSTPPLQLLKGSILFCRLVVSQLCDTPLHSGVKEAARLSHVAACVLCREDQPDQSTLR